MYEAYLHSAMAQIFLDNTPENGHLELQLTTFGDVFPSRNGLDMQIYAQCSARCRNRRLLGGNGTFLGIWPGML